MDDSKVFNLLADHVALDFVNTLDDRFMPEGPAERLESYQDLLTFAEQANLLAKAQISALARLARQGSASNALRLAREMREVLARTLYASVLGERAAGEDLTLFNRALSEASRHRVLVQEGGDFLWRWRDLDQALEAPVWLVVQQAADLLASPHAKFIRECSRESCRWLFLDLSKNHSRRWCDMKVCGNRVKAQRYYEQHRSN